MTAEEPTRTHASPILQLLRAYDCTLRLEAALPWFVPRSHKPGWAGSLGAPWPRPWFARYYLISQIESTLEALSRSIGRRLVVGTASDAEAADLEQIARFRDALPEIRGRRVVIPVFVGIFILLISIVGSGHSARVVEEAVTGALSFDVPRVSRAVADIDQDTIFTLLLVWQTAALVVFYWPIGGFRIKADLMSAWPDGAAYVQSSGRHFRPTSRTNGVYALEREALSSVGLEPRAEVPWDLLLLGSWAIFVGLLLGLSSALSGDLESAFWAWVLALPFYAILVAKWKLRAKQWRWRGFLASVTAASTLSLACSARSRTPTAPPRART
jgi:hypothetical protein